MASGTADNPPFDTKEERPGVLKFQQEGPVVRHLSDLEHGCKALAWNIPLGARSPDMLGFCSQMFEIFQRRGHQKSRVDKPTPACSGFVSG